MDFEEIPEVLEKRTPTSWRFQIDREDFNASSSTIKEFIEICVCYKECKPTMHVMLVAAFKSPLKREGRCKTK
eukprot:9078074-Ditylum_brightwellii.AAC.1